MGDKKSRPRKSTGHISKEQNAVLLDMMTENPALRSGKFSKDVSLKNAPDEWELITNKLNAIPGSQKDWRLWRKTWQDLQSKAKEKHASIKKTQRKTGGGPTSEDLDSFEQGVVWLFFINKNSVTGHEEVFESLVEFEFLEENLPPPEDEGVCSANEERVLPPPYGFETVVGQEQGSSTNGNKPTKNKINMKTLLKEKVGLKRLLVENTIQFQKDFIKVQEERNQILKAIANNLE